MSIFSSLVLLLHPLLLLTFFITPSSSSSSTETFIFGCCSHAKLTPGSAYESCVNSALTSLVKAAMFSSYNNVTTSSSSQYLDSPIYALFQCRGDLAALDCSRCVQQAVSQVSTICPYATGGALQLDGCFVRYDSSNFLGVEDNTLVLKKCGPSIGFIPDVLTRKDGVLAHLETSDGMYRTTSSEDLQGVAQCVGDLSGSECQDCLSNAIGRLREECGPAQWGHIYLAKCYARYSEDGDYSHSGNDENENENENENEKKKKKKNKNKIKNKNTVELRTRVALTLGGFTGGSLFTISIQFLIKLCKKLKRKKLACVDHQGRLHTCG